MRPNKYKKKQESLVRTLLEIDFAEPGQIDGLKAVANLVRAIRPAVAINSQFAEEQIKYLIQCLRTDDEALEKTKRLFSSLFINSDISEIMTESGLMSEMGFFSELRKRLSAKILPPLKNKGSFIYAIDSIFYKSNDYQWVRAIENDLWIELFELVGIEINISNRSIRKQLYYSLNILSYRVAVLGMEKTIVERAGKGLGGIGLPFVGQNRILNDFRSKLEDDSREWPEEFKEKYIQELSQCDDVLALLNRKRVLTGISVRQTNAMLQLSQLLERIRIIIDFSYENQRIDVIRFVQLFKVVVENENTKSSIRKCFGENMQLLAYQVAEHERNTGEHYITATKPEYVDMFKSAAGGGVIVGVFAVFKMLLHHLSMAPFWQAFSYSINYATGFILIQITGCTLATKQPAMTASTIASSLDGKKFGIPNLAKLAITISQVWRSQTAAFAGNLLVAFPIALAITILWNLIFGHPLAEGEHAQALLDEINPAKTASYVYAAIAGIFLFLSGLISGYIDNSIRYKKVPQRIQEHPLLRLTFSQERLKRIAAFVDKNMGLIIGNLMFGIFMGSAPFFGYIFGLPIDIRHITFSTANLAVGLWGLHFHIPLMEWFWVLLGIALIGFINFGVSFSLAFYVAVKSRGIYIRQYAKILHYLKVIAIRYPLDFIWPPKTPRTVEDIM